MSRYEFNPATLMQRRPSRRDSDPILDGVQHLNHERAHWSQFAGTTFGSMYMTLLRAEEFELVDAVRTCVTVHGDRPLADAIGSGRALLTATNSAVGRRPSDALGLAGAEALAQYMRLRTARNLLLHGPGPTGGEVSQDDLSLVLEAVEDVYARHTGRVRPWRMQGEQPTWADHASTSPVPLVAPVGLTTRHLLEAHARLNEWGFAINLAWSGAQDGSFEGLTDRGLQIDGELEGSATLYRWAMDLALDAWRQCFGELAGLSAPDCVSRCAPSLVACIDLALNPHAPPVCSPRPISWAELYPPERFIRAVNAVRGVGLLDSWLSYADYRDHRHAIAAESGLVYGALEERSFQSELFTEEYFEGAEVGDSTLERMSYFDYYVFASERLLELREQYPLAVAWPWLFNFRHIDGPPFGELHDRSWISAPLIWVGTDLESEVHLSSGVVVRLTLDLIAWHTLRAMADSACVVDLRHLFPQEALDLVAPGSLILRGLANALEVEPLDAWTFAFDVPPIERPPTPIAFSAKVAHHVDFERPEVEAEDPGRWLGLFEQLRLDPVKHARSVNFAIDGYRHDPREVWEIKEVRSFCRLLREHTPDWAWYCRISASWADCTAFLLLATADCVDPLAPTIDEMRAVVPRAFESLNDEAGRAAAPAALHELLSIDLSTALKKLGGVPL